MPRYKPEERNQRRMIPVSLEMQVMPGTLEFAIDRVIDECIDVSVLDGRYKNEGVGCRAYNPRMLLKVVLLGYSRGLESSRDIELACRENVTFQAMTGGWMPDHSTIAAFVSGLTEEVKEIFCQVLLVCADEDLLGGTHFSLDGVKLPSNASKEWSGTIEELTRKEKKLREKLDKIMKEHEAKDKEEDDNEDKDRRNGQIERLKKKVEKIRRFVEETRPKVGTRGKETKSNITDNESAKMATSHGVIQGYNANALVDSEFGVVVHAEAFGKGQDQRHAEPMLKGASENAQAAGLGEDYLEGKILTADTSYHSDKNLKACEDAGMDAYIPDKDFRKRDVRFTERDQFKPPKKDKKRERFTREDFEYDSATDTYTCPRGEVLKATPKPHVAQGYVFRQYRTRYTACRGCPNKAKCVGTGPTERKHLDIPVGQVRKTRCQRMREKIDTERAREIYQRRFEIVEPVFGNIRAQKGLDRFTLRGKIKVSTQWMLYCLVHNLEKIAHFGASFARA
jgi:transposase/IS5 family transposase